MKIELAHRSLYNLLEVAAEKREPILTDIRHRRLGKTTALISFARDNDYTVLVGSNVIAKWLIKEYGYRQIRSVKSICLDGIKGFVIDECCREEDIEKLGTIRKHIITGFQKRDNFYLEGK